MFGPPPNFIKEVDCMFTVFHRWILALLTSTVLITGCGTSTSAPPTAAGNPVPPPGAVRVSLLDYSISPAKITVPAGPVTLYVTNDGKTPHNFFIRSPRGSSGSSSKIVVHSGDLKPGQAGVVVATLSAGEYTFFCAFAGHESLGMIGDFTVT
ncbi:MAG: hypothetical protein PVS3B2_16350 [Candidatus Dormibacteraceae bacterium]